MSRDARGELGSGADSELAIDLREVPGDGVRAEAELGCDITVPPAGDDELDDLPLGFGELVGRGGASADATQLGVRSRRPEARAEPLEAAGGQLERLTSVTLVLRSALHGSEREQRPAELEWVHTLRRVGLDGRRPQHLDRSLVLAARSEEESPATVGEGTECGVRFRRALVEQSQQPLRSREVTRVDERLDPYGARDLTEDLVELGDVREEGCGEPPRRTCVTAGQLERREGAGQTMDGPEVPDAPGSAQEVRGSRRALSPLRPCTR